MLDCSHEQKHENDFWEVIWGGTGYKAADDRDHDFLNDDWERTQQLAPATGHGPWTFDVPAYGGLPAVVGTNAAKDNDAAFETERAYFSWGDDRADIAAKDAINMPANLGIDAQDWSDLKVNAGITHDFEDDNPPLPPASSHKQTCQPTTSGNNKQF